MPKRDGGPRGGIRQRLAAYASASGSNSERATAVPRSSLANLLLGDFFWGEMTAPAVQRIAAAACKDFETAGAIVPEDLKILASLGSSGRYPGKINGQIHAKFAPAKQLPSPTAFQMPFLAKPGSLVAKFFTTHIFLPHILFSSLYHDFPVKFKKFVCESQERLRLFWSTQQDNPQLEGHAIRRGPDFKSTCVPISLHGDAVVMTGLGKKWAKGADVFSWHSMVATGSTCEFNYLIWAVWGNVVSALWGQKTKREFWRILAWSFKALQSGYWPREDHHGTRFTSGLDAARAGTPLCGTGSEFRRAVLWAISSDLDFYRAEFGFPSSQAKHEPCPYCPATGTAGCAPGMHMNEFRPANCAWKDALTSKTDWLQGSRCGGGPRASCLDLLIVCVHGFASDSFLGNRQTNYVTRTGSTVFPKALPTQRASQG